MFQFRSPDHIIDVRIDKVDGHPLQPAQDETSQLLSHSSDTAIPFFTLYLRITEEEGRRKYDLLKGQLDSIIVFCGLFSATVAALIVPSIDPTSQSTAPSNDTQTDDSQGYSPSLPNIINLFWIYGLIFSIYCALHALVLQQLAQPRTWVTSPRYSLPEQARMAAYFTGRIERAEQTVRRFQILIIVSLFIFFLGLVYYLFSVDFVTAIIATLLIVAYPVHLFIKQLVPHRRYLRRQGKILEASSCYYTPSAQEKIQEQGSRSDSNVLTETLDMSRSDDDLEQFFEAIPGFCASKLVDNPRSSLEELGLPRLAEALIGFWNRTLSSNRVTESVKVRRLVVCVRLIETADLSIAVPHILHLFYGDLSGVSRSVETGHSLRRLRNGNAASLARGIISNIISDAERNERWSMLAMDELGISKDVLRDYLAHGDSVLLANVIHITRQFFHSLLQHDSDLTRKSSSILSSLSKFDILNTLPELQRDFCGLWNEVVQKARSSKADDNPFIDILVAIRHLYVDLHGTDIALGYFFTSATGHDDLFNQPASYPLCLMPDHRPQSTTHVQEAKCTTRVVSQNITTAEPITQTPSSTTGDQPPNEGISRQESSSSKPMNALLPSNPQLSTISAPRYYELHSDSQCDNSDPQNR